MHTAQNHNRNRTEIIIRPYHPTGSSDDSPGLTLIERDVNFFCLQSEKVICHFGTGALPYAFV